MAKTKKIKKKSISEYIHKKLEDKQAFSEALHKGMSIKKLAKSRGVKLVQPI